MDIETLKANYQDIENRISLLAKQKIGKTPYQALRIDNEMNKIKDEKYNLHVEIKKQYPIINSLLIDYSYLNLLQIMDMISICKKELSYNAIDTIHKKYPEIYYNIIQEIERKIYYYQF